MDIARNLGLNKSTVSNIVSELLYAGIVIEGEVGEPGALGGRRPIALSLNRHYGCVLGVEVRPDSYTALAVDMAGEVVFEAEGQIHVLRDGLSPVADQILADLTPRCHDHNLPLLGAGFGLSGVVAPREQIIKYSIPLNIRTEFDFGGLIGRRFPYPIFAGNDANCCAWGELTFHRNPNPGSFVFVLIEFRDVTADERWEERTAVGLGIVINGAVFHGTNHSAGEFRSILRDPNRHPGQFGLTAEETAALPESSAVRARFFRELSKNLALLANTFNLDSIYLGGDIEPYRAEVTESLSQELKHNWPYGESQAVQCDIRFSSFGNRSVAYGAAGMVLDRLFMNIDVPDPSTVDSVSSALPLTLAGGAAR